MSSRISSMLAVSGFLLNGVDAMRIAPLMMQQSTAAPTAAAQGVVQPTGGVAGGLDTAILVQGGSLRTWSYRSPSVEQVQVVLSTEGRPLDADIELWHGPDNTPVKMRVYCENGQLRPFNAVIETPRGPNTVAIRNIGQIEFPIAANVVAENVDWVANKSFEISRFKFNISESSNLRTSQGSFSAVSKQNSASKYSLE